MEDAARRTDRPKGCESAEWGRIGERGDAFALRRLVQAVGVDEDNLVPDPPGVELRLVEV